MIGWIGICNDEFVNNVENEKWLKWYFEKFEFIFGL